MGTCNGWERALFALSAALAVSACDPAQDAPSSTQDGPTFLTVIPAAVQPAGRDEGVAMVVQARGGSQIGITTYGGKHRYALVDNPTTSSCAELPGTEPLYILVKPDDVSCVLEARLYADCDPNDGGSAAEMCNSGSAGFVTSVVVPVTGAILNHQADAGVAPTDAASADVFSDVVTERRTSDVASDAANEVARGDR